MKSRDPMRQEMLVIGGTNDGACVEADLRLNPMLLPNRRSALIPVETQPGRKPARAADVENEVYRQVCFSASGVHFFLYVHADAGADQNELALFAIKSLIDRYKGDRNDR